MSGGPAMAEHPATRGMRTMALSMGFNLLLAIAKTLAGTIGHSYALIADGIESLSDVFSSLVVWVGLSISRKPPDENHPYGHGKAEPMAASIVALALFGAAAVIFVESLREIVKPHTTPAPFTLVVLAAVVLIKETLFRYVARVGESVASTAVKTDAWHHRSDAITSALAFLGITVALVGGKGWERADDVAAMLASLIIGYNAWNLLRPAVYELSDEAAPGEIRDQVAQVTLGVAGVLAVEKCFARKMGFDFYVDLHLEVDGEISVHEGHRIAHEVKDAIRAALPRVAEVLIHVEPHGVEHSPRPGLTV